MSSISGQSQNGRMLPVSGYTRPGSSSRTIVQETRSLLEGLNGFRHFEVIKKGVDPLTGKPSPGSFIGHEKAESLQGLILSDKEDESSFLVPALNLNVPSSQVQALIRELILSVDEEIPSPKSQDPSAKTVEEAVKRKMLPEPIRVGKELSQEGISPLLSPEQRLQVLFTMIR